MARYEIIGRPPDPEGADAVRRDFASLLRELESSPTRRVTVTFGFAWGNKIYERDWLPLDLTGSELRDRVGAAEASGLGRIGSDDLSITLPDIGVERTYCHEADIHVCADDKTNSYLEAQRERWVRSGWHVDGREVA